jgi:hypothetical protein
MPYKPSEEVKLFLPFLDLALEHFGPIDIWWRGQACSE